MSPYKRTCRHQLRIVGNSELKARETARQLERTARKCPAGHHLTINVTGILTGCTLELELVAVTVIVKVPAGVPTGGGGAEPPPQPMQSSTANAPAAKTHRGMCLLALPR